LLAIVFIILFFLLTPNTESRCQSVIDKFAYSITRRDVPTNVGLFAPSASIDFHRLMIWLAPPSILTPSQWGTQLDVYLAEFITNHMLFSNCNISYPDATCIGYYTYTYDVVSGNYPSIVSSFTVNFQFVGDYRLNNVEVLPNATSTLVWYSYSGVEPPGPILSKKKRSILTPLETTWNILQEQILALLASSDLQEALAVCNTTQYILLKAVFDPLGTNSSLPCNYLIPPAALLATPLMCTVGGYIDSSCFINGSISGFMRTINMIAPNASTGDFTITGGPGIAVTGLPNGIRISNNVNITISGPLFTIIVFQGTLTIIPANQTANTFLAGPLSGPSAPPTFRPIDEIDLPSLNLSVPTDIFTANNSAQYGSISFSTNVQSANNFWAGPNGGPPSVPTFRSIDVADFTPLAMTDGQLIIGSTGGSPVLANLLNGSNIVITNTPGGIMISASVNASAIGTVYSVDLSLPASLFSISGNPVTTSGTLTGSLITQLANSVFAGPSSGGAATPTFRSLVATDLPVLGTDQFFIGQSGLTTVSTLTAGSGISITNVGGITQINGTTVDSVGLAITGPLYTVSGSPVNDTGTLTATLNDQAANAFFVGPVSGAASPPTFRSIDVADFGPLGMTDGQLIIGSTGGVPVLANLLNGSNIVITNTPGGIIISASVNGSAAGTVISVGLSLPASLFSVSGSPITTSGTLTGSLITQLANSIFAGPSSGGAATPTFRSLVAADLPVLGTNQFFIGQSGLTTLSTLTAGSGISIVNTLGLTTLSTTTSVGLSITGPLYSISGSPVTTVGTLTATLLTQSANLVFAGPTSGAASAPTFRNIVFADLPVLTSGQLYIGTLSGVPVASTIAAGTGITVTPGSGTLTISASATVSSVGLSLPVSIFSISGSPVTASGTLTGSLLTQTANTVWAGPASGGAATPTFRSHVLADLPQMTNGQLYIGATGGPVVASTLTGTANQISVSNSAGSITLSTPQNINTGATPTFASMTLSTTSNQLILGTTNTIVLSASAPSSSRTYTLPDAGANAHVVLDTGGALTIGNTATTGQVLTATGTNSATWQTTSSGSISASQVSSTTSITGFGSLTYTVATGMTMVLASGTWQISFSSMIETTNAQAYSIQVFNDVTGITDSIRRFAGVSATYSAYTQAIVVSDGVNPITLQWIKEGGAGTADMHTRSMFAIKLA